MLNIPIKRNVSIHSIRLDFSTKSSLVINEILNEYTDEVQCLATQELDLLLRSENAFT